VGETPPPLPGNPSGLAFELVGGRNAAPSVSNPSGSRLEVLRVIGCRHRGRRAST